MKIPVTVDTATPYEKDALLIDISHDTEGVWATLVMRNSGEIWVRGVGEITVAEWWRRMDDNPYAVRTDK